MSSNPYTSIFFCEDGKITREMFYAEFEAILDGMVPLPEYVGKEVKAIYVEISPQIKILAAVYFLIGFDGAGNADRRWNLPLHQLAEQGEPGPNLGAGPIHLACRSQCPVLWYAQSLWDPDMGSDTNDFTRLRDVVKTNKLGLKKIAAEDNAKEKPAGASPVLSSEIPTLQNTGSNKVLAENLMQLLRKKILEEESSERGVSEKNHRLLMAAQKNKYEDEINTLEGQHSEEVRRMQEKFQESRQLLEEQKKLNEKLQHDLSEQTYSVAQTKNLFEQKLTEKEVTGSSQLDVLKQDFSSELKRTIDSLKREFNEILAAKDQELVVREEEKSVQEREIARLSAEKVQLISAAGEQFMQSLAENKLSFVAYHQGTGHITIGVDEIGEYLANPIAFVAHHCKVPESVYRLWLKHHESPVCGAYSELKGAACGKHLKPVLNPSQFVVGRSDRCPLHWTFGEEVK